MVEPGAEIANAVTGERLVFRKTSAQTGGAAVVIETFLRPYASGMTAHTHPKQEERFEVLGGSIGFQIGRRQFVAGPGHRLTVEAGTPHRLWNAGDEEAHLVSEIRPALQFEQFVTTLFALAAEARRTGIGAPNFLRLAVVLQAHFDTARLPSPAAPVQRLALALAAPVGRLLGYPTSIQLTKENPR